MSDDQKNELVAMTPSGASVPMPTYDQIKEMSHYFARGQLFGVKTPEEAFSLLMIAQSEGMHPARAMQEYHVISGRPTLKAEAMLARYQRAGGKVEYLERTSKCVRITFTHASSGSIIIEWTFQRASTVTNWNKKQGREVALTESQNYKNYPAQMLSARCISEGVRASYPACITGFYAPEEVEFFTQDEEPVPPQGAPVPPPAPKEEPKVIDADFEEKPPAPPPPPEAKAETPQQQKLGRKDGRDLFSALQAGVKDHETSESLRDWGRKNKANIERLPDDWGDQIFDEYGKEMRAFLAYEEEEAQREAAIQRGEQPPNPTEDVT